MRNIVIIVFAFSALLAEKTNGQKPFLDSIRVESSKDRIMETVSYFSDVFGPRFLGTPNYYKSILYAQKKLEENGISTHLDSFDRGYRGWNFSSFGVEMSSPNYAPISAYPLAFTQSTKGAQEGELIFIERLQEAYDLKGKLRGKIILFKALYYPVQSVEGSFSERLSDEVLTSARANPDPNDVIIGYHSRISVPGLFANRENYKQRMSDFFHFLEKEGVIATIEPSDYPYGLLHVDGNRAVPSLDWTQTLNQ